MYELSGLLVWLVEAIILLPFLVAFIIIARSAVRWFRSSRQAQYQRLTAAHRDCCRKHLGGTSVPKIGRYIHSLPLPPRPHDAVGA